MGAVFFLMQTGLDAHVHGQVSPSLLQNLVEFQASLGTKCIAVSRRLR